MSATSVRRRRPTSGIRADWVASATRRSSIARAGQPVARVASCSSTEKEPLRLRSAIASATWARRQMASVPEFEASALTGSDGPSESPTSSAKYGTRSSSQVSMNQLSYRWPMSAAKSSTWLAIARSKVRSG